MLSPEQANALKIALLWWELGMQQVLTISGFAGTGKSFLVKMITEQELRLLPDEVMYMAFTGKAALVLNQKGVKATTIHRAIYETHYDKNLQKFIHTKKAALPYGVKLIVIDEISMVPNKLLEELKSYGIRIIALGDIGQLPAIGERNNLLDNPDITLTKIHRQAEGDAIIHVSMLAREGRRINYGWYGDNVCVIDKDEVTEGILKRADQILCGKNDTRQLINEEVRDILGFKGSFPHVGDKLICTKNNWNTYINLSLLKTKTTIQSPDGDDIFTFEGNDESESVNLINGMIGYCQGVSNLEEKYRTYLLKFRPEFLAGDFMASEVMADAQDFKIYDFKQPIRDREEKMAEDYKRMHGTRGNTPTINSFDFGYAITVHKSQGSQWDNLFVYNEYMGRDMYNKWLYTAVTRAVKKLIIAK